MRSITILLLSIFVSLNHAGFCQTSNETKNQFTVMFYNVENLFDTKDDPKIHDDEFTPEGTKNWTLKRYSKKIDDIARVISSIGTGELPEMVGLSEVENKQVLKDLISNPRLRKENYSIVHYNSPDTRGIDVALLYRKTEMKVLSSNSIPIIFPSDKEMKVRDILYVKGLSSKDTIHTFVNHWKSRYGGKEATEPKRVYSARVLKSKTDSILNQNSNAKIVIIGDFNDEPTDKSLMNILEARPPRDTSGKYELYNLLYPKDKNNKGTYNYKYEWYMLDNFIVSRSFLKPEKGYQITPKAVQIFKPDWLLYDNPKAGMKVPNRTYGGPNYYGGFSDHLAIYGVFELKEKD